jgi:hypothetical protein
LGARVQLGTAPSTSRVEPDVAAGRVTALCAADDFAKPRHVDVPGSILRNAACAGRGSGLRGGAGRGRPRTPVPVLVLVATLPVLSVAHGRRLGRIVYRRAGCRPARLCEAV